PDRQEVHGRGVLRPAGRGEAAGPGGQQPRHAGGAAPPARRPAGRGAAAAGGADRLPPGPGAGLGPRHRPGAGQEKAEGPDRLLLRRGQRAEAMSTWLVRREGSPRAAEVPSAQRVLEGLRDGDWDPTDEVRGPADSDWVAIENHPQFAAAVAEMEPPPPPHP